MRTKLRFEVIKSRDRQFYWHCVHRNGNILFASETYTRRQSALKSMWSFINAMVKKDYEMGAAG